MPEGPSIVILKEAVQIFKGQRIIEASGNSKALDPELLKDHIIEDFKSWGKHFLICLPKFTIRIHFMLFGSYRINEQKNAPVRLKLQFPNGELTFYSCSVKVITQPLDEVYDWSVDVLNKSWDAERALQKLIAHPQMLVCDALLDQHIFAGVGNIIKNEVLFRIHVHPESRVGKLPIEKLKELVKDAIDYSYLFLEWKKEYTLKKHWQAHTKSICPRDNVPFQKGKLGKNQRRSFFCTVCQKLYV